MSAVCVDIDDNIIGGHPRVGFNCEKSHAHLVILLHILGLILHVWIIGALCLQRFSTPETLTETIGVLLWDSSGLGV